MQKQESESVSQPPHTRHNTSPKYKEHKREEKCNHIPTTQQTHISSIQGREEPQRNTSVEETHTTDKI
jgi:hypothetical protein